VAAWKTVSCQMCGALIVTEHNICTRQKKRLNNYSRDSQLLAFSKWYNMPNMILCSEHHYIVAIVTQLKL